MNRKHFLAAIAAPVCMVRSTVASLPGRRHTQPSRSLSRSMCARWCSECQPYIASS